MAGEHGELVAVFGQAGLAPPLGPHAGVMTAPATAELAHPLPVQTAAAGTGADTFRAADLHQTMLQAQDKQQQKHAAALLHQASNNAGDSGGDFLNIAQALAASGLLGIPALPFGSDAAAALGSLPDMGQLQSLQGLGRLQAFSGLEPLSLQALQGMGPLQLLQDLDGSLPASVGPSRGATAFPLGPPAIGVLQPPLAQRQLAAAGCGRGMSPMQQLNTELLHQLTQLNKATMGRAQHPGAAAASSQPAAATAQQQQQQEFEALLRIQPDVFQQLQEQAGPTSRRARQQCRKPGSGKGQAVELPADVVAGGGMAAPPATAAMVPQAYGMAAGMSAADATIASLLLVPPFGAGPMGSSQQLPAGMGCGGDGASDSDIVGTGHGGWPRGAAGAEGLAEARRKNCEAQQRFRQRQRAAVRKAEMKHNELTDQVTRLRIENNELEQRNRFLSVMLGVRDSMLLAFSLGQHSGTASYSSGCSNVVVRAQRPHDPGQVQQGCGWAGAGEVPALAHQPADSVGAAAGALVPLGTVCSLRDTSNSTDIEEMEPASHGMLDEPFALRMARELNNPEDYTAYFQQAQVEMRFALQVCHENGDGEEDQRAVESTHRLMQDVWQHVVQLFPGSVKTFLRNLCAPDGNESERWEALASKVQLADCDLQVLHRGYCRYLKQSTRIAQDRSHLQGQLQRVLEVHKRSAADPAAWSLRQLTMQGAAALSLQVLDLAQGLNGLADEEFNTMMNFCLAFFNALGHFQMAMATAEAVPFVPHFLDISRRVLHRAAETGQLVGSNGARLSLGEVEVCAEDEQGDELVEGPRQLPVMQAPPTNASIPEASKPAMPGDLPAGPSPEGSSGHGTGGDSTASHAVARRLPLQVPPDAARLALPPGAAAQLLQRGRVGS